MTHDSLKELLQTQFRPFIREEVYAQAFDQGMKVFDQMITDVKASNDQFYLFMHHMILHMMDRIAHLESELALYKESFEKDP